MHKAKRTYCANTSRMRPGFENLGVKEIDFQLQRNGGKVEVDGGDGKMCLQITRWWSRAILRLWNRHQSYLVECTKLGSQIDIRRKYPISAVLFHELATHTDALYWMLCPNTNIY